jgi:hypothetical protein
MSTMLTMAPPLACKWGAAAWDEKQGRLEIGADQIHPGRFVDLADGGRKEAGGVVHQPVQPPETFQARPTPAPAGPCIEQVGLQHEGGVRPLGIEARWPAPRHRPEELR